MRTLLLTATMSFLGINNAIAETTQTIQTGYVLSIWFGIGHSQTQSFYVFEGALAYNRCESALAVLKAHIATGTHIEDEWAECLKFDTVLPNN
jgi:hypothetical protein